MNYILVIREDSPRSHNRNSVLPFFRKMESTTRLKNIFCRLVGPLSDGTLGAAGYTEALSKTLVLQINYVNV
jgi:hypothetical protein